LNGLQHVSHSNTTGPVHHCPTPPPLTLHRPHSYLTHILTFVVRVPDAEMAGLGFNPWGGHLGTWDFPWGRSQRNFTLANSKQNLRTPLPISLRWLECVADELSALAVKTLSLSYNDKMTDTKHLTAIPRPPLPPSMSNYGITDKGDLNESETNKHYLEGRV